MRLDGVRILDLTRLLPGPYATQLLADLGATVIKVEAPGGDPARYMQPMTPAGIGAVFDGVNRGKQSITLNLKTDAGRDAFYRLVDEADAVIEGFRPGVADRLGVDYGDVSARNPDVVYCSLSGYGQTGPDRDRVGHDLNYVGAAGLLDMTRASTAEKPRIPGYPIADMAGGLFAAFSLVSALLARAHGAGGTYVDLAMTDVVLSFSQYLAPTVLTGRGPRPGETPLSGEYPWYDVYETADGRHLTLAALEPRFWQAFCETVERPALVDVHMTDDPAEREALREELTTLFRSKSREEWLALFDDVDATVGPVNTPAEAFDDPRVAARDLVVGRDTETPRMGFPALASGGVTAQESAAPDLGEDTDTVLASAGFDADEIEQLRDAGAI